MLILIWITLPCWQRKTLEIKRMALGLLVAADTPHEFVKVGFDVMLCTSELLLKSSARRGLPCFFLPYGWSSSQAVKQHSGALFCEAQFLLLPGCFCVFFLIPLLLYRYLRALQVLMLRKHPVSLLGTFFEPLSLKICLVSTSFFKEWTGLSPTNLFSQ